MLICTSVYTQNKHEMSEVLNVFGEPMQLCCQDPMTGFYRDGHCYTGPQDHGTHIVCAKMTKEFLEFSKSCGNDLLTPIPAYSFPGLKPGDFWCLCVSRWVEALDKGKAPPIKLDATHIKALEYVPIEILEIYDVAKLN